MGFMQCQSGASHCVRKVSLKVKDSDVVEPNQRVVMVAMAIGMIAGALLMPSSKGSCDTKIEMPLKAATPR
jgi:hypothetical protein